MRDDEIPSAEQLPTACTYGGFLIPAESWETLTNWRPSRPAWPWRWAARPFFVLSDLVEQLGSRIGNVGHRIYDEGLQRAREREGRL